METVNSVAEVTGQQQLRKLTSWLIDVLVTFCPERTSVEHSFRVRRADGQVFSVRVIVKPLKGKQHDVS